MRLGTRLYHFNSGPPIRHDPNIAGEYGNHFQKLEVAFFEESVSGPTLSDLLDKLPAGHAVWKNSHGVWEILSTNRRNVVASGRDLPQLLVEFGRG